MNESVRGGARWCRMGIMQTGTEDSVEQVAADLRAAGLRPGGVVLVHSSLRSLGPVPGGAETVVRGFLRALGKGGTLLMPALSYASVNAEQPVFDVLHTPSCVGALPEYFRTRTGTLRSVHPTHSVAGVGAQAKALLAGHEADTTPCGPHSPFSRLREAGGQLCFLGCGLRPNTSMHAVEEHIMPPYLFGPELTYTLRFADGTERRQTYHRHGFKGWLQRYDRLAGLLGPDALQTGACLQATVHLLDIPALWDAALAALRRNPLYFVEPESK